MLIDKIKCWIAKRRERQTQLTEFTNKDGDANGNKIEQPA